MGCCASRRVAPEPNLLDMIHDKIQALPQSPHLTAQPGALRSLVSSEAHILELLSQHGVEDDCGFFEQPALKARLRSDLGQLQTVITHVREVPA